MNTGNLGAGAERESHHASQPAPGGGESPEGDTRRSAILATDPTIRGDDGKASISQVAPTEQAVVTGAPIAQHDNVHSQLPADISDRPHSAAQSVDAPSIGSSDQPYQPYQPAAAAAASGANDGEETGLHAPVQEAPLAEEQELEAEVCLPFNSSGRDAAGVVVVMVLNACRLADC